MVSWNIDELDQQNLKMRTTEVVRTLKEEAVDIVFLQVVIPETFAYLESKLPEYKCFGGFQYFIIQNIQIHSVMEKMNKSNTQIYSVLEKCMNQI